LSPLLFNLVLDPFLRSLDEHEGGFRIGSQRLKVLAFADDLVLVARTVEEAQFLLTKPSAGLQECGLTVVTNKCSSFQIVAKSKTWATRDPGLSLEGCRIPFVNPGEDLSYLGVDINPWNCWSGSGAGIRLLWAASNCARSGLKPRQKMEVLVRHVIPRFLCFL
jgi:hypothetical protein